MSEPSHIERERDEAMTALQNIQRWCIQRELGNISADELRKWTRAECDRVFYGEENV